MMAGTGVSAGGAGMLRARRRDVSVKPNRKLDRKSSRGMIYENEELRLRTIHINAEVEQGQNDIKKLRRENEQLRREIWSLRDEYDKLEDILKNQKNREDSEENENRSEGDDKENDEDAEGCSDYSDEEDDDEEEYDEENEEGAVDDEAQESLGDHEERLENAENQKISSEKMNNSLHRLHVEFDDLSVVDEEEELKKDKERKDVASSEDNRIVKSSNEPGPIRTIRSGYQGSPAHYGSPGASGSGHPYYADCPFVFPNPSEAAHSDVPPMEPMLLTPCPIAYNDENLCNSHLTYGAPLGWQSSIYPPNAVFPGTDSYQSSVLAAQTAGLFLPSMFAMSNQSDQSSATASTARATSIPRGTPIDEHSSSTGLINLMTEGNSSNSPNVSQRRNVLLKQPTSFYRETIIPCRGTEAPNSADAVTRNGWDFGPIGVENRSVFREMDDRKNGKDPRRETAESGVTVRDSEVLGEFRDSTSNALAAGGSDRPKHFFAPLPAKIQHGRQDSNDKTFARSTINSNESPLLAFFESYGTGRSSSSDRTNSTVISAKHLLQQIPPNPGDGARHFFEGTEKGSADVCFNGAIPAEANVTLDDAPSNDQRSYKSSENLLIEVNRDDDSRDNSSSRQGSNNPLVKSISCQDLTSELMQNSRCDVGRPFNCEKTLKFAKSDNTLDNPVAVSSKPFRSQLNVTLKCPAGDDHRRDSPETPEIPKLPSIDYRLFGNPFLKSFEPMAGGSYANYGIRSPLTRPLSIQVNDDALGKSLQQPAIDYSSAVLTHSFARRLNPDEKTLKSTRTTTTTLGNEVESDRHRVSLASTSQPADTRIISSPKLRQDFQVTSFEQPNPRCIHPTLGTFDTDPTRRIPNSLGTVSSAIIQNHRKLYQNVPFVPGATGIFCTPGQNSVRMFYENQTLKVPAQTQTSIDGGSNNEDEAADERAKNARTNDPEDPNVAGSPGTARRKKTVRKGRSNQTTEKRPLSPAAQRRRLRKQTSVGNGDAVEAHKIGGKSRKFSPATTTATTTSEHLEDKNESRSSSSGQESPRKDQNRRVSLYFNNKKRSSLASVKTARSTSIDNTKDSFGTRGEPLDTTNSERERTNSASSREAASGKARKSSVSSGKVPWCACWGNGCV